MQDSHRDMGHVVDVVGGGRDTGRSPAEVLTRLPLWLRRSLLAAAALALAVLALPTVDKAPAPARPVLTPATCVAAEQEAGTEARMRAREARRVQIRAVPRVYRRAAEQASLFTKGRVPAEFFLALAHNRTLYGAMLTNPGARPYAARGPVQWDLREFAEVAVPGHRNAAEPLDSFLGLAEALRRAGAGQDDDAFTLSLLVGSSPDQARADAEVFDVLRLGRPGAPPVRRCRAAGSKWPPA